MQIPHIKNVYFRFYSMDIMLRFLDIWRVKMSKQIIYFIHTDCICLSHAYA